MKDFIKNNKHNIILFLIPFICCSIILFIYYPGIYTYDVFAQLNQIKSSSFTNAHPFMHTFYLMIFHKYLNFKIGVPLFQTLLFCTLWMLICKYNRKDNTNKKVILFQYIVTIFISINPMILTTIISNSKDSLFMLIFMAICYLLQRLIDNKFNIEIRYYIVLSFLLVMFSNIRHNGYYANIIFVILLLVLFIKFLYRNNKKKIFIFIVSLILFSSSFNILEHLFNVNNNITAGSFSSYKALLLDGYLYNSNVLSENEIKELSKYVDLKTLQQYSNPEFMDNLALVKKSKKFDKDSNTFIKMSIKFLLNHKYTSVKFYRDSCPMIWKVVVPKNSIHNYLWIWEPINSYGGGYNYKYNNTKVFDKVNTFLEQTNVSSFYIAIFYSPAVYLYLSIALTIIMLRKKYKNVLIITIYNLINVFIISISIPMQDARYLLNNYILAYMLMIILINVIFMDKKKKI